MKISLPVQLVIESISWTFSSPSVKQEHIKIDLILVEMNHLVSKLTL